MITKQQIEKAIERIKKEIADYQQRAFNSHDLDYQFNMEIKELQTALSALDLASTFLEVNGIMPKKYTSDNPNFEFPDRCIGYNDAVDECISAIVMRMEGIEEETNKIIIELEKGSAMGIVKLSYATDAIKILAQAIHQHLTGRLER